MHTVIQINEDLTARRAQAINENVLGLILTISIHFNQFGHLHIVGLTILNKGKSRQIDLNVFK